MIAFFWTINKFKRKGRIEQSFYSAVKIVFALVCLLFFFSEKGGRDCWESSDFLSFAVNREILDSTYWRSDRFRNFLFQVNHAFFFLFFFFQYFQRD